MWRAYLVIANKVGDMKANQALLWGKYFLNRFHTIEHILQGRRLLCNLVRDLEGPLVVAFQPDNRLVGDGRHFLR